MKPVLVKLTEINKYILENYKQQGTNKFLQKCYEIFDNWLRTKEGK
jgi:hypothetical protein